MDEYEHSLWLDRNRSALESNGMLGRERVVCHLSGVQHDMGASISDLYFPRYLCKSQRPVIFNMVSYTNVLRTS